MATATGNSGVVKLVTDGGTLAAVGEIRSFSIEETRDTIESTVMGNDERTYLAGQGTATVSIECYWDSTDAGQQDADDSIRAKEKIDFEILPNGTGSGTAKYSGEGFVTSKSISVASDGMIECSLAIQVSGSVTETIQ
jgi:hypothetical protein